MAKRFIDTGIFDDEFFSELSTEGKLFWVYFFTKCDHAGFLKYNERLIKFQTGIQNLDTVIKEFGNRIQRVSEVLLFLPKFIVYQYPGFPNCRFKAGISAIKLMEKNGIDPNSYLTVCKELPNSIGIGIGNVLNTKEVSEISEIPKNKKATVKKKFTPPSIEDVKNYFVTNGYSEAAGERAWKYYDEGNWIDGHNTPVINWKQKMIAVWFKPENKQDSQQPKIIFKSQRQYQEEMKEKFKDYKPQKVA